MSTQIEHVKHVNEELCNVVDNELEYLKPEEKIYDIAIDKNIINWKSFLYELIYTQGLNPWDIDLGLLTKKYILSLQELKSVDFDISGKFLTIAVYLLKTKTEILLDKDIRGMENTIASLEHNDDFEDDLGALEEFDEQLENVVKKKKKYQLKYRNPLARKRKVTIFDLIKTLEKTIDQSNKRRANFFQRKSDGDYNGPMYNRNKKDLKQLIAELYEFIIGEIGNKKGHVTFGYISTGINHKFGILEKFIPLLHLHNDSKIKLKQCEHFGDIEIHKINKEESIE